MQDSQSSLEVETPRPGMNAEASPNLFVFSYKIYFATSLYQIFCPRFMLPSFTFQEREKLLKEISELDALRAKKAQLLNPHNKCLTPPPTLSAPTPKGDVPRKSPPSSARAPSSASHSGQSVQEESDGDDEKEPLLYILMICIKHHMEILDRINPNMIVL